MWNSAKGNAHLVRVIVLGIETSCDETAAAVVRDDRRILAGVIYSQLEHHAPWGGVVPEVAARAHLDVLDGLIARAMAAAGLAFTGLDGVAATGGPGLIGGVIVGVMTAKAIALAAGRPFIAVNHLEAHALTARLTDGAAFPYLLLLVSGGHCQLLIVEGVGRYRRLGTTIDDALGEAFDKVAKLLGMGYPGGPALERAVQQVQAAGPYTLDKPAYKRVPKGFDARHVRAEWLRYARLAVFAPALDRSLAQSPELVEVLAGHFSKMAPVYQWLIEALRIG